MAPIVTMDRRGRITLPATTRRRMRLGPGSRFILQVFEDGLIIVDPLDVDQLAHQIEKEMGGVDIDKEIAQIEREVNAMARRRYPALARRLKKRA